MIALHQQRADRTFHLRRERDILRGEPARVRHARRVRSAAWRARLVQPLDDGAEGGDKGDLLRQQAHLGLHEVNVDGALPGRGLVSQPASQRNRKGLRCARACWMMPCSGARWAVLGEPTGSAAAEAPAARFSRRCAAVGDARRAPLDCAFGRSNSGLAAATVAVICELTHICSMSAAALHMADSFCRSSSRETAATATSS